MFLVRKFITMTAALFSVLAAQESLSHPINSQEDFPSVKEKSQFLYIAGGINPFPTLSLG